MIACSVGEASFLHDCSGSQLRDKNSDIALRFHLRTDRSNNISNKNLYIGHLGVLLALQTRRVLADDPPESELSHKKPHPVCH